MYSCTDVLGVGKKITLGGLTMNMLFLILQIMWRANHVLLIYVDMQRSLWCDKQHKVACHLR